MWRRVVLARTDVSEEYITSIIRVIRIGELGQTSVVISNRRLLRRNVTLMMEVIRSSELSVFIRATRGHVLRASFLLVPSSLIFMHTLLIGLGSLSYFRTKMITRQNNDNKKKTNREKKKKLIWNEGRCWKHTCFFWCASANMYKAVHQIILELLCF
jgi:hypothetical protein